MCLIQTCIRNKHIQNLNKIKVVNIAETWRCIELILKHVCWEKYLSLLVHTDKFIKSKRIPESKQIALDNLNNISFPIVVYCLLRSFIQKCIFLCGRYGLSYQKAALLWKILLQRPKSVTNPQWILSIKSSFVPRTNV